MKKLIAMFVMMVFTQVSNASDFATNVVDLIAHRNDAMWAKIGTQTFNVPLPALPEKLHVINDEAIANYYWSAGWRKVISVASPKQGYFVKKYDVAEINYATCRIVILSQMNSLLAASVADLISNRTATVWGQLGTTNFPRALPVIENEKRNGLSPTDVAHHYWQHNWRKIVSINEPKLAIHQSNTPESLHLEEVDKYTCRIIKN